MDGDNNEFGIWFDNEFERDLKAFTFPWIINEVIFIQVTFLFSRDPFNNKIIQKAKISS